MIWILVAIILVLAVLWGLASISQSYAAAKQAEAAIEASRAAQISSTGNLVVILLIAILVIVVLAAISFAAWFYYRLKIKRLGLTRSGHLRHVQQHNVSANDLLPSMMAMMLYQMMQQQRPQFIDPRHQLSEDGSLSADIPDDVWTD